MALKYTAISSSQLTLFLQSKLLKEGMSLKNSQAQDKRNNKLAIYHQNTKTHQKQFQNNCRFLHN